MQRVLVHLNEILKSSVTDSFLYNITIYIGLNSNKQLPLYPTYIKYEAVSKTRPYRSFKNAIILSK